MTHDIYKLLCALLIAIAFSVSIYALSSVAKPIGSDFYFHLQIASYIAKGDLVSAWALPFKIILFPYGFLLFHFALSPLVLSGNAFLWAKVLEALLMPTTFALTLYLVIKKANAKSSFITGLCLLGSMAFVDGTLQLRPETFDILLYPLMLFAVLSVKKKSFITLALLTIYSHGLAALVNIYGVAVKLLRERQWRKTIMVGLIGSLPVILLSIYYIEGAFKEWFTLAGANNSNPQQTLFWTNPFFIPFYSGLTLIGFVFLFKRHKTYFESLLSWGIIASAIMIPFWADRWLQYITIPLSCLVGLGLKDTSTKKLILILPFLLAISFLYILNFYLLSTNHQWWQP